MKIDMKIALVGSCRYEDRLKIKDFLFKIKQTRGVIDTIIGCGHNVGTDYYVKKYALEFGFPYMEYPPYHKPFNLHCAMSESSYGRPYHLKNFASRNGHVAKAADRVVAFIQEKDNKDNKHPINIINMAIKKGKPTIIIH